MSERGQQVKADLSFRQWENSEFPILCESCLGETPYVRMMIDRFGGTCKMCERPFSLFKWRPGRGEGYKKTEVCQACARTKNLCQTCLLDMQLGLPSQLRDAVLAHVEGISETTSDANREYIVQQQLIALDNDASDGGMLGEAANEKLIKIARTVATNRKQDRVKIPLPPPPPAQEKLTTKRNAGEALLDSGISNIDQLSSAMKMSVSRMPEGFKNLLTSTTSKGEESEADAKEGTSSSTTVPATTSTAVTEETKKKGEKKMKFTPKPPSGPPPPSATVKQES